MDNEYFDIIVIIPLEEELREFMKVFPSRENRSSGAQYLHVVDTGDPTIRMLVTAQQDMGKQNAALASARILDAYKAGIVVCLGIAGSISNDMELGDVCYSGSIVDVLENSKAIDDDDGELDLEFSSNQYQTFRDITTTLNFIRTQPDLNGIYEAWQKERADEIAKILSQPAIGRDGQERVIAKPQTRSGSIACGTVSKSKKYNAKLHALDRKILAIETESGGVFSQAQERGVHALTIRGISDYADHGKSALEKRSSGNVRSIAAANAVSFLKLQFKNHYFVNVLKSLNKETRIDVSLAQQTKAPTDIYSMVRDLGQSIDEKLRELSPEFRLLPKGYRLPVPRVKMLDDPNGIKERTEPIPREIREVVEDRQMVLINLQRTYPEQSLAWVIADDLMKADIAGKQAFPIVIDGDTIKPPKSTFEFMSQQPLAALASEKGAQLVFIVENIPLGLKSRLKFLIEQIQSFSDAKFVFISRDDVNLVRESEFLDKFSMDVFRVCKISFVEIAHFIEKNFSMTGSAAEVVALRLRDTFNRFDLTAHPTYFAGIPREMLSALLQANRRAELIQLAVDGFLTFLVAGDGADIPLSRTTRSRFLRKLVFAMKVEKSVFNQTQLIDFTGNFAKQHDFNIDPIAFIQAFVEKGILHFDNDLVRFSLPFIESYLLAVELAHSPEAATKYFDPSNSSFDLATFDLYAEIGADTSVILKIFDALEANKTSLKSPGGRDHVLLTDELQPAMIRRPERLEALRASVRKAAEDVQKGRNDNERKQKLLDIADRVRETVARQAREASVKDKVAESDDIKRLNAAVQAWVIGTTLLGSGAEHLDGQTKRRIASDLVCLASRILDEWTRVRMTVDMNTVKTELTSDETIDSFHNNRETKSDREETKKLIISLVDVLEYHILAQPFFRIMGQLCEQARQPVLAMSLEGVKTDGKIERLIWGSWLADVEGKRGKEGLIEAVKDLPFAPFLRITLASHYLMRVYWNHWQREDRLVLLEAAEEAIEPMPLTLNKDGLKRMIKREDEARKDDADPAAA